MENARWIWFDMDGTLADLYGSALWLEDLRAERVRPYKYAKPLLNMQALARVLNRLNREGYEIGIISWLSKSGSPNYNERVAEVKREWLKKHLASVKFARVDIVEYGVPKQVGRSGILFDDEAPNRNAWGEGAYDVDAIIEILRGLN